MPIRPRISDPYGQDYKDFEREQREGPRPTPPRKPSAEERRAVIEMLHSVRPGVLVRSSDYGKWIMPYITNKYALWGAEICFYPSGTRNTHGDFILKSIMVMQLNKNRHGTSPKLKLTDIPQGQWYGEIIRWIGETVYGL